jgi:hypothetical protein
MRFYQDGRQGSLFAAFLLFGLAMWDKALAAWVLSGLTVSAVLLFPRQVWAAVTPRRAVLAVLGLTLGSLPLLVYNTQTGWLTFTSTTKYDGTDIPGKARLLMNTAQGQAMFVFLLNEDYQTAHPHEPVGIGPAVSARISSLVRHPRHHLMLWGFVATLFFLPFAGRRERKAALFALIAMAVAWIQMAFTANAGGSVHHAILLWPLPYIVMGAGLAGVWRHLGRVGSVAIPAFVGILLCSSLVLTNEYYATMLRNGGAMNWTDAIFPLADYLKEAPSSNIFCMDWGILDSLRLLDRGKLPVRVGTDPISKTELTGEDRDYLKRMLSGEDYLFINHTRDFEFFEGVNDKLVRYAGNAGYGRQVLARIPDSYGRPVYEVYRLVPSAVQIPRTPAQAHEDQKPAGKSDQAQPLLP